MSTYGLRVLPSYPWSEEEGRIITGGRPLMSREDAEEVRRVMCNGAHFEVVEIKRSRRHADHEEEVP